MPDGYIQRDNKKFGFYKDKYGKKFFYPAGSDGERKEAKTKARVDNIVRENMRK